MAQVQGESGSIVPAHHQPELPLDRFIRAEAPDAEHVPLDVLFVGAGPAGLAGAIELAGLVAEANERSDGPGDVEIGVLEKAESLGEHCLSGAIVDPAPFRELFPDLEDEDFPFRGAVPGDRVYLLTRNQAIRMPAPPTMRNHGNFVASICEIVRWMGDRAEAAGVNIFTGFPAESLLVEDDRVTGVRTAAAGLERNGEPGAGYMPPTDITARVTALAEGTRGSLTQAWLEWRDVASANPQIYALGVKEVWETRRPLENVVHTLGWPLPNDAFGGSFFYPMAEDQVALGLVVGLDYPELRLDVHELVQRFKTHPLLQPYLEGGELLEWGGKTIPEGGYHAVPERRSGDGVVILGDAAGFVDVASLKGIHYAVQSGIYAARAIFEGLRDDDSSAAALRRYDERVNDSYIMDDLHARRNMRLAFKKGFYRGGASATLMTLSGGRIPGGRIESEPDAEVPRVGERADATAAVESNMAPSRDPVDNATAERELAVRKLDAVFKSGNQTRDDIPSHLIPDEDVPAALAEFYGHMCPAGVYERGDDGKLVINAPNCIDCKATDVLGPRWTPREGGSGPKYRRM